MGLKAIVNIADPISYMFRNFSDDYDILYTVNDSLCIQQPGIKYHILRWNTKEQYCIARDDNKHPSEKRHDENQTII